MTVAELQLRDTLKSLAESLAEAREAFAAGPRPPVEALNALTARLGAASAALDVSVGSLTMEERLEAARAASGVRAELALLGRLAAGGAAFTALIRELDTTLHRAGLYGPTGAGESPPPPSLERRV